MSTRMAPDFRILGPLEVVGSAGDHVPLGGRKRRALLAVLLPEAGRPVSADRIVDAVWPEADARSGRRLLQVNVSTLRQALGPGPAIEARAGGYVLDVEPEALDAAR